MGSQVAGEHFDELFRERTSRAFRSPPIAPSDGEDHFGARILMALVYAYFDESGKHLRDSMLAFAAHEGRRFIREFDVATLGRWRTTWPNKTGHSDFSGWAVTRPQSYGDGGCWRELDGRVF